MANGNGKRADGKTDVQRMRVIIRAEIEIESEDCINDLLEELNKHPQLEDALSDGSVRKWSIEVDREVPYGNS